MQSIANAVKIENVQTISFFTKLSLGLFLLFLFNRKDF